MEGRTTGSKIRPREACVNPKLNGKAEKHRQALSVLPICIILAFYQVIWLLKTHFQQSLFLHPNGKLLRVRHQKGSRTRRAEVGSSDHTWQVSQESALTPTPTLSDSLHSVCFIWGTGLGERLYGLDSRQPGKRLLSLCMPLKCCL